MRDQHCDLCRFYVPGTRECRRFPPVRSTPPDDGFPLVHPALWCGEFEPTVSDRDRLLGQLEEFDRAAPRRGRKSK